MANKPAQTNKRPDSACYPLEVHCAIRLLSHTEVPNVSVILQSVQSVEYHTQVGSGSPRKISRPCLLLSHSYIVDQLRRGVTAAWGTDRCHDGVREERYRHANL